MSHVIEAFRQGLNEAVIGKRAQLIKELSGAYPGITPTTPAAKIKTIG